MNSVTYPIVSILVSESMVACILEITDLLSDDGFPLIKELLFPERREGLQSSGIHPDRLILNSLHKPHHMSKLINGEVK